MHRKSLANSFTMTLTALAIVACSKSEKPDERRGARAGR